jgi:hypothetical protein
MAKKRANHWFVSVEMPKGRRMHVFVRQTKTFPTEAEAKQFAKEMLSEGTRIVAGTLLSAQSAKPTRRIISGWDHLGVWIGEA